MKNLIEYMTESISTSGNTVCNAVMNWIKTNGVTECNVYVDCSGSMYGTLENYLKCIKKIAGNKNIAVNLYGYSYNVKQLNAIKEITAHGPSLPIENVVKEMPKDTAIIVFGEMDSDKDLTKAGSINALFKACGKEAKVLFITPKWPGYEASIDSVTEPVTIIATDRDGLQRV